jgi:hypothetical protein
MQERIENEARRSRLGRLPVLAAALAAAAVILVVTLLTVVPGRGTVPASYPLEVLHGAVDRGDGEVLVARGLVRVRTDLARKVEMILAPGTRFEIVGDREVNLLAGRVLAKVLPGDGDLAFRFPAGTVEVTGTLFDLDLDEDRAVLAVLEGAVLLRTGDEPVRLDSGRAITIPRGGPPTAPVAADPWRVRAWCSTPTPRLSFSDGLLTFTLENDTPTTLLVKSLDPGSADYSLQVEGEAPRRVTGAMVRAGAREPGKDAFRSLAPGERYHLVIDARSLGLPRGTWRVSAVYRPYGDMPRDAWRGNLVSPPCVVTID